MRSEGVIRALLRYKTKSPSESTTVHYTRNESMRFKARYHKVLSFDIRMKAVSVLGTCHLAPQEFKGQMKSRRQCRSQTRSCAAVWI